MLLHFLHCLLHLIRSVQSNTALCERPAVRRCGCDYNQATVSRDIQLIYRGLVINCHSVRFSKDGKELSDIHSVAIDENGTIARLDFSATGVRNLPPRCFANLRIGLLVLDHNELIRLDESSFEDVISIRALQMRNVKIKSVPTEVRLMFYKTLESLDVSQNDILEHIDSLSPRRPTHIRFLNLSATSRLKVVRELFSGLDRSLEVLDLSHKRLTQVPGDALSSLRSLNLLILSNNLITKLDASSLQQFRLPAVLDLTSNSVSLIALNVHKNLDSTRPFSLIADNNFVTNLSIFYSFHAVEPCLLAGANLSFLNNPIACDCDLLQFVLHETVFIRATCQSPDYLRHIDLHDLRRGSQSIGQLVKQSACDLENTLYHCVDVSRATGLHSLSFTALPCWQAAAITVYFLFDSLRK